MTTGIQSFNDDGLVQITSDQLHPVLIQSGRASGSLTANTEIGFPSHDGTTPIILIRPDPGVAVGGFVQRQASFVLRASGGFDYAVFSVDHPGIHYGGNFGLQIFNEQGALIFDSNNRHARIKQIVDVQSYPQGENDAPGAATAGFGRYYAERPWIMCNDLGFALTTFYAVTVGPDQITLLLFFDNYTTTPGARASFYYGARSTASSGLGWGWDGPPFHIPICHIPGF